MQTIFPPPEANQDGGKKTPPESSFPIFCLNRKSGRRVVMFKNLYPRARRALSLHSGKQLALIFVAGPSQQDELAFLSSRLLLLKYSFQS